MRTIKELLTILLESEDIYKRNGVSGLCSLANIVLIRNEARVVEWYIINNRPRWYHFKHYHSDMKYSAYFWKPRQWEPRKRWLKAQIKKLKE